MQTEEEGLKKLYRQYKWLTIISLYLMALLQGLHAIFFSIFFWLSLGFGLIALNYYIALRRKEQPNVEWQRSGASSPFQNKGKLITTMIAIVIGGSIVLATFGLILSSDDSDESQTQAQTAQENSSGQSNQATELTAYQLAAKEYDNQDYRKSISMCRQALSSQPQDIDLILLLGDNYGSLKQYDSSYVWFSKAYELGARSAYLSHWMAYFYDEKGETSRAIEFYKDAVRQDSTRTQIYDRLAELEPSRAAWYKSKSDQWRAK
jgi:tetratricopeptide (TPR) repeat protein